MLPVGLRFREASAGDAYAVAELQADSWRRHYRGAYADSFLDEGVREFLGQLWAGRLAAPDPNARTILAEHDGAVVGLAHTILGADPAWGSLLDNLHVVFDRKRLGIGARLLALTGQALLDWQAAAPPSSPTGLYLWVLEQNTAAQAFYAACGGQAVERAPVPPPGGDDSRLDGQPLGLRYAWRDLTSLAAAAEH